MSQLMASANGRSLALLATAAAATAFSSYFLFRRLYHRQKKEEGILKLIIYPIKSLAGIEVDRLQVTRTGMVYGAFHDRSYILLSEPSNVMITQRAKPKLSLIRTSFSSNSTADQLVLEAPGLERLTITSDATPSDDQQNEVVHFQVWGQDTSGIDCGSTVNAWFSRYLGSPCRLVKFTPDHLLRAGNVLCDGQVKQDPSVPILYQDQTPALLLNEYSVEALNGRLAADAQITYRNFRPNILVRAGGGAWAEDAWQEFRLGAIRFYKCKPCTRCTLTTVIPERGVKHPGLEPFTTLKTFRVPPETEHLYGDSPLFGISLATHNEGLLTLDDEIHL